MTKSSHGTMVDTDLDRLNSNFVGANIVSHADVDISDVASAVRKFHDLNQKKREMENFRQKRLSKVDLTGKDHIVKELSSELGITRKEAEQILRENDGDLAKCIQNILGINI